MARDARGRQHDGLVAVTALVLRTAWRRFGVVVVSGLLGAIGAAALGPLPAANAQLIHDPSTGRPLSCPDPSVLDARSGQYRYYLVCTSDNDRNAFPIRGSNDLVNWYLIDYLLPAGRQPWWALHSPKGRYWAPSIYRIDNRWVVYFAAQENAARVQLSVTGPEPVAPKTWVIGVATSGSLHGPWQTKIIHYRGQFNDVTHEQEDYGGVIDPSMVEDPRTHQLYLFWAEQQTSIWAGKLSADGLTLDPQIHQVLWASPGWDCAPVEHECTIEGPEELYRNGWFYLFYSGASTWSASYAVGVVASTDPLQSQFMPLNPEPVLKSGNLWVGPGGASHPVLGPDGKWYLFYHASHGLNVHHISARRFLLRSPITWTGTGGYYPQIGDGRAG